MSMKRLALIAAVSSGNGRLNATEMSSAPGAPPPPVQGVNVMLGGAMLSGIILVIFVMCYCCHKNARKLDSNVPHAYCGRDWSLPLHVYTIESAQQCYDSEEFALADIPVNQGPPPAYEAVVPIHKNVTILSSPVHYHEDYHSVPVHNDTVVTVQHHAHVQHADDTGLPTYEAALQQLEVRHL